MNIKRYFKERIFGNTAHISKNVFVEAERALDSNDRLGEHEKQFIRNLYAIVQAKNNQTDYEELARTAPGNNIEFWYESAVALMLDMDEKDIDTRPNGRLQTANVILGKIIEHSYKVAPFWAQRITVLDCLATGYIDSGNTESACQYIQAIFDATTKACEHFPEIVWFANKQKEMKTKYGQE